MLKTVSLVLALALYAASAAADPFRFYLFSESTSLDPQTTASANSNYVFHLIYRGLYSFHSGKGLQPAGAESCERAGARLTCRLSKKVKWSTGSPIEAKQYLETFRRLIDPRTASPEAHLLFTLKNAREIYSGKKPPAELGVSAPDSRTLIFEFSEEDFEFEYKLTHPALTPVPPGGYPDRARSPQSPASGPYKIVRWKTGSGIRFEPNTFYPGNPKRPPAEAVFVDEDSTALRLYESGKLSFLRRLIATEVPRWKASPEFHQIPQARFDYIGFGPDLVDKPALREALVAGVDFQTFMNLFSTISPPGCPSLPSSYLNKVTCQKYDLARAQEQIKAAGSVNRLNFGFSRMGGDDIARISEWFQGQWNKNIGVKTNLNSEEQTVYVAGLKVKPPDIFRKGISLGRPTCMAGLEIFTSDSPDNLIRLKDPEYDRLVRETGRAKGAEARRKACGQAVARLLATNRLIPLGEMYFTILVKTRFTGWDLNELNQLDLSNLQDNGNHSD
jgi:ABC-type oligopeptide transport system substrate-binding subunit